MGTDARADEISGRVTDGIWVAPLAGDRAVFRAKARPTPYAGRYTMVLGQEAAPTVPAGIGYGTGRVSVNGLASFAGSLADRTKVTRRVPLSKHGLWPFSVSLYSGRGLVMSWIAFTNEVDSDFSCRQPCQRASRLACRTGAGADGAHTGFLFRGRRAWTDRRASLCAGGATRTYPRLAARRRGLCSRRQPSRLGSDVLHSSPLTGLRPRARTGLLACLGASWYPGDDDHLRRLAPVSTAGCVRGRERWHKITQTKPS